MSAWGHSDATAPRRPLAAAPSTAEVAGRRPIPKARPNIEVQPPAWGGRGQSSGRAPIARFGSFLSGNAQRAGRVPGLMAPPAMPLRPNEDEIFGTAGEVLEQPDRGPSDLHRQMDRHTVAQADGRAHRMGRASC
jgi:hypothetical protein